MCKGVGSVADGSVKELAVNADDSVKELGVNADYLLYHQQ